MIFLLFARADHPEGYGFSGTTRAHGYAVLVVSCETVADTEAVKRRCAEAPVFLSREATVSGFAGHHLIVDEWYGGRFDYIGAIAGTYALNRNGSMFGESSYGDNRYFGIVDANTVLNALRMPELPRHPDQWKAR